MKKIIVYLISFFLFSSVVFVSDAFARKTLRDQCEQIYLDSKECPDDICQLGCFAGLYYQDCPLECQPKLCFQISAESCPEDHCQVLEGCSGQSVCHFKDNPEFDQCGELGYSGSERCCEGYVKRCGIKVFGKSCDMEAEKTHFSVPICLACGNGTCEYQENSCNCPEDCF